MKNTCMALMAMFLLGATACKKEKQSVNNNIPDKVVKPSYPHLPGKWVAKQNATDANDNNLLDNQEKKAIDTFAQLYLTLNEDGTAEMYYEVLGAIRCTWEIENGNGLALTSMQGDPMFLFGIYDSDEKNLVLPEIISSPERMSWTIYERQ